MYIRCVGCKSASRAQLGRPTQDMTCNRCGRAYDLSAAAKLGSTPQERYQRALGYAEANGLDLASAYSVLLGIMPLEMGQAIHESEATAASEPAAASDSTIVPTPTACPYDLAFQQAVNQGHLTVRQAMERGDRVVFASKLVQKRGLKMSQAFMVADNRLTIRAALQMQREQASEKSLPAKQSGHSGLQRHTKIGAIGTLAVAVLAGAALVHGPDPGEAHFSEARKLVTEFEKGKEPASVNYDDAVYRTALAELAFIDDGSSFSAPAKALEAKIRGNIEAYHQRLQVQRASSVANRQKRSSRMAVLHQARKSERLRPPPTYEECEH